MKFSILKTTKVRLRQCFTFLATVCFGACVLLGCEQKNESYSSTVAGQVFTNVDPTWVEIDASALRHNVQIFKELLSDEQKLCAVIKTDAYFIGAELAATAAVEAGADALCFVSNIEAWKIRDMGIQLPLIRIAPGTEQEVKQAIEIGGVEELVGSVEHAQMISKIALEWQGEKSDSQVNIPVHVNVNTAMTRMAIYNKQDLDVIAQIPGIKVKGVMSHFANSYKRDPVEAKRLAFEDMNKFDHFIAEFASNNEIVVHIANSQGALRWPEARRDMIRAGTGILWGRAPRELEDTIDLWPTVIAVKSTVALIMEDIPPNSTVGYGSNYQTPEGSYSRFATIRFGHANGYPVSASNKGYVLIHGQRFPIVGNISQNLTVVDISNNDPQTAIQIGDEVVLVGSQGDDTITLNEIKEWAGNTQRTYANELHYNFLSRNPKKVVIDKASGLHSRHLFCGLCSEDEN